MTLLSTEVEVLLQGVNISYYENLGYKIPRVQRKWGMSIPKGTTITVKVEDLPSKSNVFVDVNCDKCGKHLNMKYQAYTNYNHNGKYYCCNCANGVLHRRENNPNWKSDKTDEERIEGRNYLEYTEFIKRVLVRDNYTCQCCGKEVNGNAEVHHLDGYDWCVEKRTDDMNGLCLCSTCHKSFHAEFGYGGNTKEQYEQWVGHAIDDLERYNGILPTTRKIYCIEEDKVYDSSKELRDAFGLKTISDIHNICNRKKNNKTIRGKHILWFDEYKRMTIEELEDYLKECRNKRYRSVICLTTGKIYESCAEANRQNGWDSRAKGVNECCRNKIKLSGKLPDGTPLQWMYYEEFLKLEKNEQQQVLSRNQKSSSIDDSFIM